MKLIGAQVQGFRRFEDPVNVRLLENLIAIVGQNEAGKSSFLDSLIKLNKNEEIDERDQTRRSDVSTLISATYETDEEDKDELNDIPQGEKISQCEITKLASGKIITDLKPEPDHSLEPRKEIRSKFEELSDKKITNERLSRSLTKEINLLPNRLDTEQNYLGNGKIRDFKELSDDLKIVVEDIEADENVESDEYDIQYLKQFIEDLDTYIEHEKQCPPKRAEEILQQRQPDFLVFSDDDRDLNTTYNIEEIGRTAPSALQNLADLAHLDLESLQEAVTNENVPWREDLIEEANERLEKVFSQAWVRSDVVPVLSMNGPVLHIFVRTPDTSNRSRIDERSDGLRWFIALVAFLNQKESRNNPILLVDEAESHLSYDAQAELIEVLETQNVAQKVIYTTHSAGCLPSDLGRGIRPVVQLEGERSDIYNGFWVDDPGFKPIMLTMGLSPLAFTVTRNALIGEGPSETILLPALIRQATGKSELNYQIAPGASSAGSEQIPELLTETGQSAIILDGDEAGDKTKNTLIEAGVDSEKVRTYNDFIDSPLVLEDLIRPEKHVEAINEELKTFQNPTNKISIEDLPETNRAAAVEDWCRDQGLDPVVKPNVCQRLVEKASKGEQIIYSDRTEVVESVDEWAQTHFVSPAT